MSQQRRQRIVNDFNTRRDTFVFLLSSKAGGCGLNLVGANRLIQFDASWNPADDLQAMARVWRDGQGKTCYTYRLLSTGTIEEKIFQRQLHKRALSLCVVDHMENVERQFRAQELRELFTLNLATACDTHDRLACRKCAYMKRSFEDAVGLSSDLSTWDHFSCPARDVRDRALRSACGSTVSFVISAKSHEVRDRLGAQ